MALVLGVDSSTQSTKVEARDIETGHVIASGSASHPSTNPPISEQDPNDWWRALSEAVAAIGDHRDDVVAMAVAGQQHGLVLIDDDGAVVRPAKLWNDTTSAPQAAALVAELTAATWAQGCGSVPLAAFTIAKLGWVAQHEPDALARTAKVMLPHDYLTWRLTGAHVTDRGDASGTGWFDPASGAYQANLLGTVVGDPTAWLARLPAVAAHDEPVGELRAEIASELGLPATVLVGPGTGDNMAAAMGLGLQAGDIAVSLGTSGTVYAISAKPTNDPTGAVAGFADALGQFLPLVCTLNATKVTDTMAAWFGTDPAGLSALALEAPTPFSGVTLVPYFDGERTPNRPDASGTMLGLRTTTTRAQVAQAAHDGVLCGLFDGLDALVTAGVATGGQLHLIGGGARSAAYRSRAASLHQASVLVPDADETVATGAALQAALISGAHNSPDIAAAWSLGSGELFEPDPEVPADEIRAAYAVARGDL